MPANTSRSAAHLATTILFVLLVGGCAGQSEESTAESQATSSTVAPTTTTVAPTPAKQLADDDWLLEVTRLRRTMEKAFGGTTVYMTRDKMTSFANALGTCSRELARIGTPSDRLQPVHVMVKKACRTSDKGAKCYATAASVSMADGGVVAGTPEEKTQREALECGGQAQGNSLNLLVEAEAKGEAIMAGAG